MKIRFDDGGKVHARSICGTRGIFQTHQEKKQKEAAKAAHAKKLLKAAARKRGKAGGSSKLGGMSSRGAMSKMSSHRTTSMLRHDKSEVSMGNITFGGTNNSFEDRLQEKVSEQDESESQNPREGFVVQ